MEDVYRNKYVNKIHTEMYNRNKFRLNYNLHQSRKVIN